MPAEPMNRRLVTELAERFVRMLTGIERLPLKMLQLIYQRITRNISNISMKILCRKARYRK